MGRGLKLAERMRFEIRADSFKAFNHSNFSRPSTVPRTGDAGRGITSPDEARQIQLGDSLTF